MLREEKDEGEYRALPPYIRVFIRIIIWQVTLLYHMLKRYDMLPEFQVVTYEHYLEKMGIMLKETFRDFDEVVEELDIEEDKDKEPPLQ